LFRHSALSEGKKLTRFLYTELGKKMRQSFPKNLNEHMHVIPEVDSRTKLSLKDEHLPEYAGIGENFDR